MSVGFERKYSTENNEIKATCIVADTKVQKYTVSRKQVNNRKHRSQRVRSKTQQEMSKSLEFDDLVL